MQGNFACIGPPVLHAQIWEDGRAGVGLAFGLLQNWNRISAMGKNGKKYKCTTQVRK